jgi:hypothetical protein
VELGRKIEPAVEGKNVETEITVHLSGGAALLSEAMAACTVVLWLTGRMTPVDQRDLIMCGAGTAIFMITGFLWVLNAPEFIPQRAAVNALLAVSTAQAAATAAMALQLGVNEKRRSHAARGPKTETPGGENWKRP